MARVAVERLVVILEDWLIGVIYMHMYMYMYMDVLVLVFCKLV